MLLLVVKRLVNLQFKEVKTIAHHNQCSCKEYIPKFPFKDDFSKNINFRALIYSSSELSESSESSEELSKSSICLLTFFKFIYAL